jgi:glycosyltransferase involved in cell wall biosynthesis
VVSERVGIAAEIEEYRAGLVVPLRPEPLAEALARLLADPGLRAAMGQRGRELVRARYTGPAVATAMLAAYARARSQVGVGLTEERASHP